MAGLYEFPYFEHQKEKGLKSIIEEVFGCKVSFCKNLPNVKHTFTRFKVELNPSIWKVVTQPKIENYQLGVLGRGGKFAPIFRT